MQADDGAPKDYVGDDDFPTGMSYVIIRCGEVMIGGSAEEGVWDLVPTTSWDAVVSRAGVYVPWLRTRAEHDPSRHLIVCIRPARAGGVRLEKQSLPNAKALIHNYGHGGSGFSLSWGCADEVARLVADGSN
jgi:D-amino-acid oxidase